MKIKQNHRAFTIVELVIVIAVIAILAAVLIPTFSGIIDKANRSSAMQEARNAWNEVSYTYASGYDGFAYACDELNGWYYDYEDGVAKYTVDEKYTVTYDGENWVVNDIDGSAWVWDEITESSESFSDYTIDANPYALKVTYYTDIYSRGFAWITQNGVSDSKLYIVESNKGEEADFSGVSAITGTADTSRAAYTSHKAYVTNLSSGTVYSYKVGSESGWKYGTFKTEQSSITSITAIQLSDAQTIEADQLYVWENTMAQAIETAGHGLDMILYNGDQLDSNMTGSAADVDRGERYAIARETVDDYVGSIPYMSSSGNHEPANGETYMHVLNNTIDYGVDGVADDGMTSQGGYYSYDYGFAHFIVLTTNDTSSGSSKSTVSYGGKSFQVDSNLATEAEWLIKDLASAQSSKWIIVTMHIGAYATGDHSNKTQVQNIITSFTPIFSAYHVDLVLQAHDHTYNKTMAYKWDSAGYFDTTDSATNTANGVSTIAEVVNLTPTTTTSNGRTYDVNPEGTYYCTTGAAGHRNGSREAKDGIWADVYDTTGNNIYSYGFTNNKYKIVVGKITESNTYTPYTYNGVTSDQEFNVGDYASGNVNAEMFGILNLTETTLTYDFYTVDGNEVKLFDSLNVMKN